MRAELPDPDWYLDHVVLPATEHRSDGPAGRWQQLWRAQHKQLGAVPVSRLARVQGFVITRAQARGCGVSDAEQRRFVRRGLWSRTARGVLAPFAPAGHGASNEPVATRRAHALAAAAEALLRPGQVVSGRSGAILHGLPLFVEPAAVELTADPPTTQGNRSPALVRCARLGTDECADWFGVSVTSVARTLVDLARHQRRDGIVAADAALHEGLVSHDDLADALARCAGWPGVRQARLVLGLADARAESPLESITRLALHDEGLPAPQLQVWIADPARRARYRVDMLWPEQRVVLEADGRGEYVDTALWDEKLRQERLERLGYRVVRVLWKDVVDDWPATAARVRSALVSALRAASSPVRPEIGPVSGRTGEEATGPAVDCGLRRS